MRKLLLLFVCLMPALVMAANSADRITNEISTINGKLAVRSITPGGQGDPQALSQNRPQVIRNPHIMARTMWVDRNSEFAIAEDVTTTPDGSGIFAGWWLNNMRFAAYTSAGMEVPVWRYNQYTQWTMPVAASNTQYAGTGSGLPAFIWDKDSPLFRDTLNLGPNYNGAGVAFSGDGNLMASVFTQGTTDAELIVYDIGLQDTVFTRVFDQAQGVNGVDLSRDGTVALVSCYNIIYVFNVPEGTYRDSIYNYSQVPAKTSADGSVLAVGLYTGRVNFYRWNGTQYRQRWVQNTTHDWVSALDVSDDGSTIACGTMDFVGSGTAGKFEMWDSTGTVLIDYNNYGDMVASVALSADGRYAIAGSWGAYPQTFGDVVTCFYRESDVPIFQLQDDIDEPGSVFSVAISDSGHYAAAGGKAVNARYFGNGGMLYAIQLRDPLDIDVAISSIDQPGEFPAPGENITPMATFINVGNTIASFMADCKVINLERDSVIYSSSSYVTDVMPFFTSQVVFSPDFVLPADGRYKILFTATMDGDQDTSNNSLGLVLRSWHDIEGLSVVAPFDEATATWPTDVSAVFKNFGSYTEDFDVNVTIHDSTDTEVYSSLGTVFGLSPYAVETLRVDSWVPDHTGPYTVTYNALVNDDLTPANNTISKTFRVTNEMLYDDGAPNTGIWVDYYPTSTNRKFAQQFNPIFSAPFTVTNFRFYVYNSAYTGSLDYIGVCTDLGDEPDTTNFVYYVENPALPGIDQWANFDLNYVAADNNPLWVVMHWADGDPNAYGPFVGADNTGKIDSMSYWYRDEDALWHLYPSYDWMIRMTLQQETGIKTELDSGLPKEISLKQNYPNPFNPSTRIEFGLPKSGNVKLEVFDCLGRRIRLLLDSYLNAGYHDIIWDGKTDSGADVASGMYYYRLTSDALRISRRMTLLK